MVNLSFAQVVGAHPRSLNLSGLFFRLENLMLLQKGGGIQGAPKPEGWHGILILGSY